MVWAIVALIVLGVPLLLLAAPVALTVEVTWQGTLSAKARIRALFGLVDTVLTTARPRPKKKARQKAKARSHAGRRLRALVASRGLAEAVGKLLSRLWTALRIQELAAKVRVGFDDPADTGELFGIVAPPAVLLRLRYPEVEIAPCFQGECLEVDARGRLDLVPLEVVMIGVRFFLTPATIRAAIAVGRAG